MGGEKQKFRLRTLFPTQSRISLSTGEFPLAGHEVIDPYFLLFSSACWNGIALGAIDIAKKHVIRTDHADTGLRVADYPIIQVESIIDISTY